MSIFLMSWKGIATILARLFTLWKIFGLLFFIVLELLSDLFGTFSGSFWKVPQETQKISVKFQKDLKKSTKTARKRSQNSPKMIPQKSQNSPKMIPKKSQNDPEKVPK